MLNKEKSKEYEKYLMKKKAELLKYLRRQSVNLGKFTSMDEYLGELLGNKLPSFLLQLPLHLAYMV